MGKVLQFPEMVYPAVPQEEIDALFAPEENTEMLAPQNSRQGELDLAPRKPPRKR